MLLHEHLDRVAAAAPEAEYARGVGGTIRYGEARAAVDRLAVGFAAAGIGAGDRFAILAHNAVEIALLVFAASRVGAVPVALGTRLALPEWQFILEDAQVTAVFADAELADAIDPLRHSNARIREWVVFGGSPGGWRALETFGRESAPQAEAPAASGPDAAAFQMYTSGTTGRPKGAILSQRALHAAVSHWVHMYPLAPGDRQLLVTPMTHIGGLLNAFHAAACAATVCIHRRFDAEEVVRTLAEERIARAAFVPAMIQSLLEVPGVSDRAYPDLRWMTYGGSPISATTLRRAADVFGCGFGQSYGLTEFSCLTYLTPEDHRRALEDRPDLLLSTGRAAPDCEIRIESADGSALPVGCVGEICARGPQRMSGYWKRPQDTAEALRGDWFHTGDLGRLDAEGYLSVVDRLKDVVISGGENVYSREVEELLLTHPEVADVAVIGVPSERWGETVKAVVVRVGGSSLHADDLMDWCRDRIAGFKRPTSVDFVDTLPRNAGGKVLKRELRAPWWKGHERGVA